MAVTTNQANLTAGKFKASATGFAASGDTSAGLWLPSGLTSLSVQAVGTFAGAISIAIEGSNDGGTTWKALDETRTPGAVAFTAADLVSLLELPEVVRANATAGTGGADVDIHFVGYYTR